MHTVEWRDLLGIQEGVRKEEKLHKPKWTLRIRDKLNFCIANLVRLPHKNLYINSLSLSLIHQVWSHSLHYYLQKTRRPKTP